MAALHFSGQKSKARRTRATRYPGLTRREARALDRLRRELRAILPNGEIKSLYLYGSKPRGEANVHSDIDVFLMYDGASPEQENALQELVVEHLGKPPSNSPATMRNTGWGARKSLFRLSSNRSRRGWRSRRWGKRKQVDAGCVPCLPVSLSTRSYIKALENAAYVTLLTHLTQCHFEPLLLANAVREESH